MTAAEMEELGSVIALVLKNTVAAENSGSVANSPALSKVKYRINETARAEALSRVEKLLSRFPVYPELDLELLKKVFCP
jgi:glycine hydroxymethyltransferase